MNAKLMFFGVGLLLLIASLWVEGDAFDIQLYDTYFVIGWGILFRSMGLLCFLVGGVYLFINRKVSGYR